METKVEVKIVDSYINIYIGDIIHLCIDRNKLIGFQSWIDTTKDYYCNFFIEYYTNDKNIITEYNDKNKWEEILKQLDKL